VRVAGAAAAALGTLDRVLMWLGAPPEDPGVAAGLGALVDMTGVHAPEVRVVAWRRAGDGRPEVAAQRDGPGFLPAPDPLPSQPIEGDGWAIAPVLDRGEVTGALGVAVPGGVPDDLAALVRMLATSRVGATPVTPTGGADPFAARLDLARVAVRRALWRAERWESLLGRTGATLGVFDLAGALVTASEPMRAAAAPPDDTSPLLHALRALTPLDDAALRTRLRAALVAEGVTRLPARNAAEEVVLSPIGPPAERTGLLVQVHDIAAHRHLDQLKSSLLTATGFQARNALAAIGGFADMMVSEDDLARRASLQARVAAQVERIGTLLTRGESVAATGASDVPTEPIYLQDCVSAVVGAFDPARRERLEVSLPGVAAPVAAHGEPLARAIWFLLSDATESGRARVRVAPEREGMTIAVEDDGGGLPEPMLAELVDSGNATSAPAAARRLVEGMGGDFAARGVPGVGTRYEIRLRYF
jgi:signal transduction histidine kinase